MTLAAPKGLVLVTVVSSLSTELAPSGRESGQDCEGAYGHAPIRSLLIPSMGLVGRLENESTDQVQSIAPVPLWVRPEPRRPGWHYRSPIIADNLQSSAVGATATAITTLSASGPTVELSLGNGHQPTVVKTGTAVTRKPPSRKEPCSPGQSSWPRSR